MMQDDTPIRCWEYFDKIYCISLDERTDRRAEAESQFCSVGLRERVEFFIAKKYPHNCEQGIFESHIACIKKGIESGAETILIFEDDIQFDGFQAGSLKNSIDFLSANSHWDAFFLGCLVSGSKKTENHSVVRIKYRSLSHAYVLNRRFAGVLAEKPWQGLAYDDILNASNERFFAIYPLFAFQSNSPTDNSKYFQLDKFRRLCGGLRCIQKRNEFYHRHRIMVIALHFVLIFTGLLWFLN